MSGLLQNYDIASDADGLLLLAVQMPWEWHKSGATHYRVTAENDGGERLCLMWAHDNGPNVQRLPFPLKTPESMFNFAREWLKASAKYPTNEPDTDGSVSRGWRVSAESFYSVLEVKAEYIVYDK